MRELFRGCLEVTGRPDGGISLDVKWVKYFIRFNAKNTCPACYKGPTLSFKVVEKPVFVSELHLVHAEKCKGH